MGIPNATHQASSNAVAALGLYIAVFTAAAGTTGANEATGGGYARQSVGSWPTGGMVSSLWVQTAGAVNIPVAAGTYVEAGICSALTAGTFVGSSAFAGGNVVVSGSGASITVTPSVSG